MKWTRLETSDWDNKLIRKQFTEVMNRVNILSIFWCYSFTSDITSCIKIIPPTSWMITEQFCWTKTKLYGHFHLNKYKSKARVIYRADTHSVFRVSCTWNDEAFFKMIFQKNSQLSSCILHLCVSMGNNVRSSGQERVTDNLEEDEENSVFHYAPGFCSTLISNYAHMEALFARHQQRRGISSPSCWFVFLEREKERDAFAR